MDITDDNAFEVLQEVLAGRLKVEPDVGTTKMLHLLAGSDTDTEITRDIFQVWYKQGRSKSRSTYFRRIGPQVISTMMVQAGLKKLDHPTLVRFPVGAMALGGSSRRPLLVWLSPEADKVTVKIRAAEGDQSEVAVEPAPAGSPLEPPELESWQGSERAFDSDNPCPHCGTTTASYRDYETYRVCMACGRSFSV